MVVRNRLTLQDLVCITKHSLWSSMYHYSNAKVFHHRVQKQVPTIHPAMTMSL